MAEYDVDGKTLVGMADQVLVNMYAVDETHFDDAVNPTEDELVELKLTASRDVYTSVMHCMRVKKFYTPITNQQK